MFNLTVHTLVKNEENFIWFSLNSVLDQVGEVLVFDDSSTDKTAQIIKGINSEKIHYQKVDSQKSSVTALRNEMISRTKTDWFMLLDGDEIWNRDQLSKFLQFISKLPKEIMVVSLHTKNFVGDIFHILPEDAGRYEILGRKGHLNTRAFRKSPGFEWKLDYPFEFYSDPEGGNVVQQKNHSVFFDGHYWHATHLPRSTSQQKVLGFRRQTVESGKTLDPKFLPEVFFKNHPKEIKSPLMRRSSLFEIESKFVTPMKKFRRKFLQK